jgi:hypothetical protein
MTDREYLKHSWIRNDDGSYRHMTPEEFDAAAKIAHLTVATGTMENPAPPGESRGVESE